MGRVSWRRHALTGAICTAAFIALAILTTANKTLAVDDAVLEQLYSLRNSTATAFFRTITHFGAPEASLIAATALSAWLIWRRNATNGMLALLFVYGSNLLAGITKVLFNRIRPDIWTPLIQEVTFAFPSGHATASAILALLITFLFRGSRWRRLIICGAILYVLIVGVSRLYLGVHYATDVLGGWLLAGAWYSLVLAAYYRFKK